MNLPGYRRAVGAAIWLFILLSAHAQETDDLWKLVAEGRSVCDEELAIQLGVRAPTARRWRKKLEKAGLLRCARSEPGYFILHILNVDAAEAAKPGEEPAAPTPRGLVN